VCVVPNNSGAPAMYPPGQQEGALSSDGLDCPVVVVSHGCAKQVVAVILTHTTMTHCRTRQQQQQSGHNVSTTNQQQTQQPSSRGTARPAQQSIDHTVAL
jgi:hypothetical protein